jgi:hypothetical protein
MQEWLKENLIATLFDIFIFLSGANLSCGPMQSQQTKDLIHKIKEVMGSLNRDTVAKACNSLRSRI